MRVLLFSLLVLFSASAFADIHKIKEGDDGCTVIAKTSASVMEARQAGAPISALLDVAEKANEPDRELLRLMVIAAYEQPRYQSEEFKARAAMDFRNEVHLMCLQESGL